MDSYYVVKTVARGFEHEVEFVAYGLAKDYYNDYVAKYGSDVEVYLSKVEIIETNMSNDDFDGQ